MVVIYLILASLGVAAFVMLTDTRRNDNFQKLEKDAQARRRGDGGGGDGGGGDGGSADCGGDGGGGDGGD